MTGLEGKNVLVTGASSGIGQAIAIRFGHERANVAVNDVGARKGTARSRECSHAAAVHSARYPAFEPTPRCSAR